MRNLDVSNGLVNGVFGTVVKFEEADNNIVGIYVKFDDDRVNRNPVDQLPPPDVPTNTVLIKHFEEPLKERNNAKKSNTTRRQFPLKLGWATTIHKTQGITVNQLVYSMEDTWGPSMAYVALSRVTSLQGLFLKNYLPDKIYRNDSVYSALKTLPHMTLENTITHSKTDTCIVVHNVQGLCSKLKDIEETYLTYASVMCLTETWLHSTHKDNDINFDGFEVFRTDRRSTNCRGGVAIYVKNHILCHALDLPGNNHNIEVIILRMTLWKRTLLLVTIYRPTSVSVAISSNTICACLQIIEQESDVDTVIITGDLNENLISDETHHLYNLFLEHGYVQLVTRSTCITGSLLDVVYVKGDADIFTADVEPIYFSDHEVISVNVSS